MHPMASKSTLGGNCKLVNILIYEDIQSTTKKYYFLNVFDLYIAFPYSILPYIRTFTHVFTSKLMPQFSYTPGTMTKLDFLLSGPDHEQLVYNITTPFKLSRENVLHVEWGNVSEDIECDLFLIPEGVGIEHLMNLMMITRIPTRGCVPGAWQIFFQTHTKGSHQILATPTIPGMRIIINQVNWQIL